MDDTEHAWRRAQLDAAINEMRVLADRCGGLATWNARSARRMSLRNKTNTVVAAILATIAGASALGSIAGATFAGLVALLAAVVSTASSLFQADPVEIHLRQEGCQLRDPERRHPHLGPG
jgi:hypothetical protein